MLGLLLLRADAVPVMVPVLLLDPEFREATRGAGGEARSQGEVAY